jgi:glycosyltransferase involved in cell wall biosynthesis
MDKILPFVSIIIPAKNEEKNIGLCLGALTNIDYPKEKYELILVDNGSSDNTMTIAENFGVRVFEKPELTISGLRNYGAKMASGEYFAFVDADVVVSKEWLLKAVALFTNDSIACVGCGPRLPENPTWVERTWDLQIRAMPDNGIRQWLASMNMIIRKDVYHEVGGFNEDLITCEDVDLGYRVSRKYKIIHDKNVDAVHLGEAKTIRQFVKKEFWRGKSNFTGVIKHGIVLSEIPSLIIPIVFIISCIMLAISYFLLSFRLVCISIIGLIAFPITKTIIISSKIRNYKYIGQLLFVWFLYEVAKGLSGLDEFRRILWHE